MCILKNSAPIMEFPYLGDLEVNDWDWKKPLMEVHLGEHGRFSLRELQSSFYILRENFKKDLFINLFMFVLPFHGKSLHPLWAY